jgi:predicted ATPase/DNA-binding SARP family transcriptional activator
MKSSLQLRVLGPVELSIAGQRVDLDSPKVRTLLAALIANRGRVLTVDTLIDMLWGESPPATAHKSIHKYVSQLRRHLGDALLTRPGGYMFDVDASSLDVALFESALDDMQTLDDKSIEDALALWRGEPYPELADTNWGPVETARLNELRFQAVETLVDRRLEAGRHRDLIGNLETMVAADPFRERLWAQLMIAYYRSGRQSDALAAYQRLRRALEEGLGLDPSPELRDLEERILLHDPSLAPPPEPVASNLPRHLSSFVGRNNEISELSDLLSDHRLVTLVGTAGSGKTRLATETAGAILDRFTEDGVWFVDLSPTRSPDQVVDAVAAPLGVGRLGTQDTETLLVDYLSSRHLLLIMDNCEHVLAKVAEVTQRLLERSPRLIVLATSRERLGIPGEVVVDVTPLPYPGEDEAATLDFDAVQLFVDRVRAVTGEEDPGEALGLVGEIVRRLDGIPLALELAAARTRGLGLVGLRENLNERFSLLSSASGTDRHQTLQAAIDWSYLHLDPPEQILFARLSVFRGGFDLKAAVEVCGDTPLEAQSVPALLAGLVDKSLVEGRGGERRRYRLLETLREYSLRMLDPSEASGLRDAHAAYYCRFAEEAASHLRGPDQTSWRGALRSDQDNMRKALNWAATTSPETLVRLAVALGVFWDSVGPRVEGHEWLSRAVEMSDGLDPELRIKALLQASDLYSSQHASLPREYAERALAESRAVGDTRNEARALRALSWALALDGRNEEAHRVGMDALALFADHDDPWELALWNERIGQATYRDPEWSIQMLRRALDLYRQVGDRGREALVLYKIAEQLWGSNGDLEKAMELGAEAIRISDELGNTHDGAHARLAYGRMLRRAGRLDESEAVLAETAALLGRQVTRKPVSESSVRVSSAALLWPSAGPRGRRWPGWPESLQTPGPPRLRCRCSAMSMSWEPSSTSRPPRRLKENARLGSSSSRRSWERTPSTRPGC